MFLPIVTTAYKTLYMQASRQPWKWAGDFLLRLLFPEAGLLRVHFEEVDRSHFLSLLHKMRCSAATRQQLMAIQAGKLHRSRTPNYKHLDTRPLLSPSSPSRTAVLPGATAITWCSESPSRDSGFYQVELCDIHAYMDILSSLPAGQETMKGVGLPDTATFILVLHLVWLLFAIGQRLISNYLPSLIELYALYTLTAFVAERIITQFNVPAWQQHVVFTNSLPWVSSGDDGKRKTWKKIFIIIPIILFITWPVHMILYGFRGPRELSFTATLCSTAGGTYCAGLLCVGIGKGAATSKHWFWGTFSWGLLVVGYGTLIISRCSMLGFSVYQTFIGEREIFLIPPTTWQIPHLSG